MCSKFINVFVVHGLTTPHRSQQLTYSTETYSTCAQMNPGLDCNYCLIYRCKSLQYNTMVHKQLFFYPDSLLWRENDESAIAI